MTDKSDYGALAAVFTAWWRNLHSLHEGSAKPRGAPGNPLPPNRKALAELRRINVVPEAGREAIDIGRAMECASFRDLVSRMKGSGLHPRAKIRSWLEPRTARLEPLAIAAATVARIKEDASRPGDRRGATARLLGEGFPETHVYAEARFKRLLRCAADDWPDLMAQARRIAAILERKAPIGDLAASLVLWNGDPRIRRDWAFQYYQKSFEPPDVEPPAVPTPAMPPSPNA